MANFGIANISALRQIISYNPATGQIIWNKRGSDFFSGKFAKRTQKLWNTRWAGRDAFTCIGSHGYREGSLFNKKVLAHRIVWAIHYGVHPKGDLDHINGDKLDNRIINLRDVTTSVNLMNALGKCSNTSGFNGVSWRPSRGKWRARIMIDYKETCLGHFLNFEDAVAARISAEKNTAFTSRHGDLSYKGA